MSAAPITPINLEGGPLRESDYVGMERRWITRDLADRALIRRVESHAGAELVGCNGFKGDYAGLTIPYLWPGVDAVREFRLRRDHPDIELDSIKGRRVKRKYLSPPGRGGMLYLPPGIDLEALDSDIPLVITEGEFKALALWRLAWESAGEAADGPAFLPIAIAGVNGWHKRERHDAADGGREDVSVPAPDFDRVTWERRVTILFDVNVRTNFNVQLERTRLTEHLQGRGSEVAWFEWPDKDKVPESVNGVDDFLATFGPKEALKLLQRARIRRKKASVVVQMPGRDNGSSDARRDWRSDLITSKEGHPKPILANILTALRCAPEWEGVLAFNEFALRTVALKPSPWDRSRAGEWSDTHDSLTAEWLHWRGIHVSSKLAREGVEAVARERGFHPVREYLDSLSWDGTKRLDAWLETYLGAKLPSPDDEKLYRDYVHAVGSRWLISAVARVYQPGCKADCCLILEGPQGRLKSTALKTVAGDWFTDEIAELGTKDASMQVHGVWLVEIAELDSMSRGEVSKTKAFLSRATDRYRPPYGARVIEAPRQCVFAGSVNHSTYLRDETGGRRFWPVACGQINVEGIRCDRDQLWAEAVARYRAGSKWWLDTTQLEKTAEEEQRGRYEGDPWDEIVADWLATRTEVTVEQVLTLCIEKKKETWTQADKIRVARALRVANWERFRQRLETKLEWRYRLCSQ